MATIKVRQNGPYLVDGDDVTVVDWNGNPYQIAKRPFALCRCGGSTKKPFCDGTHSRIGFQAAEAAVPGSEDKPAIEAGRHGEAGSYPTCLRNPGCPRRVHRVSQPLLPAAAAASVSPHLRRDAPRRQPDSHGH